MGCSCVHGLFRHDGVRRASGVVVRACSHAHAVLGATWPRLEWLGGVSWVSGDGALEAEG